MPQPRREVGRLAAVARDRAVQAADVAEMRSWLAASIALESCHGDLDAAREIAGRIWPPASRYRAPVLLARLIEENP